MTPSPLHPSFVLFTSDASDGLELGADALLYVMAHGHCLSVPTEALYFAEKVAIVSIARKETPASILTAVNLAINEIAATIRVRARLDADARTAQPSTTPERPNVGPMARLQPAPAPLAPVGTVGKPDIAF